MSTEGPADHLERDPEPRLENAARRARHVVSDRLRRPRHRHLAGRPGAGRGRRASAARTRRSRAGRTRDGHRRGARRPAPTAELTLVVEAFAASDGTSAVGASHPGRRAVARAPREAQPRHADPGHRRRAHLRLVRQRPGGGARHARAGRSGRATSAHEYGAVRRAVGTRQLAGALRRSAHPALRPPRRRRTCSRSTRRPGASAGRWRAAAGRVSHSTPIVVPGPNGDELLVNSSARIDAYDPATGALLWHAGTERQTPIPSAVVPRRPDLPEPRLPQQRLLAIRPAAAATSAPRTSTGGADRRAPTCRRSSTTTACST